jgi:hypothetical protein
MPRALGNAGHRLGLGGRKLQAHRCGFGVQCQWVSPLSWGEFLESSLGMRSQEEALRPSSAVPPLSPLDSSSLRKAARLRREAVRSQPHDGPLAHDETR